jgi:hypothetical protein
VLSPLPADEYLWLLKNISWLTFPLWPLALWGIYAWRDQIRQAPLIIPLSFSVVALCSVIFTGTELYSTLLFLVPSLSVLAALGVVSLKRSRENFLDLYSGIIYTLAVIAVWIYFFAWTEGVPAKMAFSLTRLAPEVSRTELPFSSSSLPLPPRSFGLQSSSGACSNTRFSPGEAHGWPEPA